MNFLVIPYFGVSQIFHALVFTLFRKTFRIKKSLFQIPNFKNSELSMRKFIDVKYWLFTCCRHLSNTPIPHWWFFPSKTPDSRFPPLHNLKNDIPILEEPHLLPRWLQNLPWNFKVIKLVFIWIHQHHNHASLPKSKFLVVNTTGLTNISAVH